LTRDGRAGYNSGMQESLATSTFHRLPIEKQQRLLSVAKKAFADGGYAETSINDIAVTAGISIGSLYKYFRSKEDLFLTIIEEGRGVLEEVLGGIVDSDQPVLARIESLLRAAIEYSRKDPDFVRIYIDCTTQGLAPLAARLSNRIESIAAEAYRKLIAAGQARGEIDPELDPSVAAFCLDNLFLMLQYSFGCDYYRERLALFAGTRLADDAEAMVKASARFIANALGSGRQKG
ncbi:MAG TPA: TetR/AcrR family transcriptional regulator, partial [Spirochaetia bacterium]